MRQPFTSGEANSGGQNSSTGTSFNSANEAIFQAMNDSETSTTSTSSSTMSSIASSRFSLIDIEINNLRQQIGKLEVEKKDLKTFIMKSHGLNKMLFVLITLIPSSFAFVMYWALKDHFTDMPELAKEAILLFIGAVTIFDILKVAFYLPNELGKMKEDIQSLKENQ